MLQTCAICGSRLDAFHSEYHNCVCPSCENRAVNSGGKIPEFNSFFDDGDNPVLIDGMKCWRRYKFGGYVTMRDLFDSATIEEFYRKNKPSVQPERRAAPPVSVNSPP